MITAITQQKRQLTPSSVISFHAYVQWTNFSRSIFGADCHHSVKQRSTCSALHVSTLTCQPSTIWKRFLTIRPPQWPLLASKFWFMKHLPSDAHGNNMVLKPGIYIMPLFITEILNAMSLPQEVTVRSPLVARIYHLKFR